MSERDDKFDEMARITEAALSVFNCGCDPSCSSMEVHEDRMKASLLLREPQEFSGGASLNVPLTMTSTIPPYTSPECLRCGLHWKARNPQKRPTSCPRCGSGLWDQPPVRSFARRPDDPPNPNWKYRLKPIKKKCPTCGRPMRRLTVAERLEREDKARLAQAESAAVEHPARPSATRPPIDSVRVPSPPGTHHGVVLKQMTPPPGLRGPTPPPLRATQPETPEVQAARNTASTTSTTLSEELKEESE